MTELLLCLAATSGIFHRQQAVCVKKVAVVQKVVAVKQHYVPYQTLFLVAPPSYYGAPQYAAPTQAPQPTADAAGAETDKKIIEALSTLTIAVGRLEKRIDAIEGNTPPPEPTPDLGGPQVPELAEEAVPLVVRQNCAMCHGDGSDYAGEWRLSYLADPAQLGKAIKMVASGKMPADADGQPALTNPGVREAVLAALREMQ